MIGVLDFAKDSRVHDTMLVTMVITSFLAALRRFKDASSPSPWLHSGKLFWNFLFDWATGFWSMKQGQPLHPITTQQVETHTSDTNKDVTVSTVIEGAAVDPITPVAPAQPK